MKRSREYKEVAEEGQGGGERKDGIGGGKEEEERTGAGEGDPQLVGMAGY